MGTSLVVLYVLYYLYMLDYLAGSMLMPCNLLSGTYYTTYLYLLIPLVIFRGEHFERNILGGKKDYGKIH